MSLNVDFSILLDFSHFSQPRHPFIDYLETLAAFSLELNNLNPDAFTRTKDQFEHSAEKVTQYASRLLNEFSLNFKNLRDGEMIPSLLQKVSCAYSNPHLTFDQKNVLVELEEVLEKNQQNIPQKFQGYLPQMYRGVASYPSFFANDISTLFSSMPSSHHKAQRTSHSSYPGRTIQVLPIDWSGFQ